MYRSFHTAERTAGCGPAFDKRQFGEHRGFHQHMHNIRKAPVSIYKTEGSYEVLVFAPGRIKDRFQVGIKGNEITVSYTPEAGQPDLEWISREYSRGGFERRILVDETVDTENIVAKYEDGVLQLSLAIKEGSATATQEIKVN